MYCKCLLVVTCKPFRQKKNYRTLPVATSDELKVYQWKVYEWMEKLSEYLPSMKLDLISS